MPILNNAVGLYRGSTAISKIYRGANQIWPDPTPPGGFVPSDLSGLFMWYDADDSSTQTLSGGFVQTWANKAPGATSATTLDLGAGNIQQQVSYNGQTHLYFPIGSYMSKAGITFPSTDMTAFCLVRPITWSSSGAALWSVDNAGNDFQVDTSNNTAWTGRLTGLFFTNSNPSDNMSTTVPNLHIVTIDDSVNNEAWATIVRNTAEAIGPKRPLTGSFTTTGNTLILNRNRILHRDLEADQLEFLLYDRVLSNAEKNQVIDYFNTKWGLTLLNI